MTLSVMTLGLLIWRLYDRDPFFGLTYICLLVIPRRFFFNLEVPQTV